MTPYHFALKVMRKLYGKAFGAFDPPVAPRECDIDKCQDMIYGLLAAGKPCMVARFGAYELNCVCNYLSIRSAKEGGVKVGRYIKGYGSDFWWNQSLMEHMQANAGFFPPTGEMLSRFCERMLRDAGEVDVLGSWLKEEYYVRAYLKEDVRRPTLLLLEPFFEKRPWTRVLAGRKVLVVHPFARLIERQYAEKRALLFKNPDVLPEFELKTVKAVQSLGGESNGFNTWFDALQWMEDEMDKTDYDICLIGCGAYGFPLAAHAKRSGKQAVHLGGSLQLLFGIKGKRWENPDHGAIRYGRKAPYLELFNEHWRYPEKEDVPKAATLVEGGCYWGGDSETVRKDL